MALPLLKESDVTETKCKHRAHDFTLNSVWNYRERREEGKPCLPNPAVLLLAESCSREGGTDVLFPHCA